MVERLATPRRNYPFVVTKLAIVAKGLLAFVEGDTEAFLEAFKAAGRADFRCEIVPAYGFDLVICDQLRIPIPAASLQTGRSLMDHIAATGSVYVFASRPEDLIASPVFELAIEKADLLVAKGHYEMACLLNVKPPESSTTDPGQLPDRFRESRS